MQPLIELIRREVIAHGILSFARFMELALYCPDYGYYEANKDNPGRRGDFYTSVNVGELFGQLLAFQFAGWLEPEAWSQRSEVGIIEAGAHDGTLAGDILNWLQRARPGLFGRMRYCIVEPSLRRQEWQREKLGKFAPRVHWFADLKTLARATRHSPLHGVIFSNELLDAMPVHRFGWDATAKAWFEWGVALAGEKFVWAKIRKSEAGNHKPDLNLSSVLCPPPSDLLAVLPDGYTVEMSPAAEDWWREAAGVLERGRLLTLDYGLTRDEWFSPSRPHGTLRAYFRQHVVGDLLANAGEQDLTAHVNFPAIQAAGESAGLTTESFLTQAQFLTRILEQAVKDKTFGEPVASQPPVSPKSDGDGSGDGWNASRTRQFQTLTHPEHLGRAFRVLIQFRQPPAVRS
jgi:SAM-dependent MidA family methyltransferase